MAGWVLVLIGLGVGMVGGFFLACALGMAKESDRHAEIEFLRMRLAESIRDRERHAMGSMMKVVAE